MNIKNYIFSLTLLLANFGFAQSYLTFGSGKTGLSTCSGGYCSGNSSGTLETRPAMDISTGQVSVQTCIGSYCQNMTPTYNTSSNSSSSSGSNNSLSQPSATSTSQSYSTAKEVYLFINYNCYGFDNSGQVQYGGSPVNEKFCTFKNTSVKWMQVGTKNEIKCFEIDSNKIVLNNGQAVSSNICRAVLPEELKIAKGADGNDHCYTFTENKPIQNTPVRDKLCENANNVKNISQYSIGTLQKQNQIFQGCIKTTRLGATIINAWVPVGLCLEQASKMQKAYQFVALPEFNYKTSKFEPSDRCVQIDLSTKAVLWDGTEFPKERCSR